MGIIPLVGVEYMPQQDQGMLNVEVELPSGTRFEETGRVCKEIVSKLNTELEGYVKATFASYGVGENMESLIMNPKKLQILGKSKSCLFHEICVKRRLKI
jgi:multidrug efflux pump subunit AcrB